MNNMGRNLSETGSYSEANFGRSRSGKRDREEALGSPNNLRSVPRNDNFANFMFNKNLIPSNNTINSFPNIKTSPSSRASNELTRKQRKRLRNEAEKGGSNFVPPNIPSNFNRNFNENSWPKNPGKSSQNQNNFPKNSNFNRNIEPKKPQNFNGNQRNVNQNAAKNNNESGNDLSARQLKRLRGKARKIDPLTSFEHQQQQQSQKGNQKKDSAPVSGEKKKVVNPASAILEMGSIKTAVVPKEYPNVTLDQEQMNQIQNFILEKIDTRVAGTKPTFNDCTIKSDCLVFDCFNNLTRVWLKTVIEESPIEGVPLTLIDARHLGGWSKVSIFIPEKDIDVKMVLKRIGNQNECLKTDKWRVIHSDSEHDTGTTIFANIDTLSLKRIKQVDCKLGEKNPFYIKSIIIIYYIFIGYKFSRINVEILGEIEGSDSEDVQITETTQPVVVVSDSESPTMKQHKEMEIISAATESITIDKYKPRPIWICP
jgi:hypothetical protein